ncbi:unnamed protein product, partial [Protopolystoma xenopodis]
MSSQSKKSISDEPGAVTARSFCLLKPILLLQLLSPTLFRQHSDQGYEQTTYPSTLSSRAYHQFHLYFKQKLKATNSLLTKTVTFDAPESKFVEREDRESSEQFNSEVEEDEEDEDQQDSQPSSNSSLSLTARHTRRSMRSLSPNSVRDSPAGLIFCKRRGLGSVSDALPGHGGSRGNCGIGGCANSGKKLRKARTAFTDHQLNELEQMFE